jgi:hypothetical protein
MLRLSCDASGSLSPDSFRGGWMPATEGMGQEPPPALQKSMSAECDRRVAIAERFLQSFRTRWRQCTLTRGQADRLGRELPKNGDVPRSPLP